MKSFILILLIVLGNQFSDVTSLDSKYLISKDSLKQLDEWEIRLLRDFARGRGRAIVEKIPLDELNEENEDEKFNYNSHELIDLNNPAIVAQGGMFQNSVTTAFPVNRPPQPRTQFVKPKTRTKLKVDNPSIHDYKQLASVIQMFIDRRSNKSSLMEKRVPHKHHLKDSFNLTTSSSPKNNSNHGVKSFNPPSTKFVENPVNALPSSVITVANSKDKSNVTLDVSQESVTPRWKSLQRFTTKAMNEKGLPDYEKRMKQLSAELSNILRKIEEFKGDRAQVHILRNGSAEQTIDGQYVFIATLTLVQDAGKNILVDTGLGTNINGRTKLLKSLRDRNLSPADIDIVITTHGHPDHTGGVFDFPDATHYYSWYSHFDTKFNLTALFENDSMNVTENVMLVKAKGHTSDDIALIVRNVKGYGDVLVAGDLFIREEDIDHNMMWQPLSADLIAQTNARRKYGCIVDWIVPGHGSIFQVTNYVKRLLKC